MMVLRGRRDPQVGWAGFLAEARSREGLGPAGEARLPALCNSP